MKPAGRKLVFACIYAAVAALLLIAYPILKAHFPGQLARTTIVQWIACALPVVTLIALRIIRAAGLSLGDKFVERVNLTQPVSATGEQEPHEIEICEPKPLGEGAYVPGWLFCILGVVAIFVGSTAADKIAGALTLLFSFYWFAIAVKGHKQPALKLTETGITCFGPDGLWPRSTLWRAIYSADIETITSDLGDKKIFLTLRSRSDKALIVANLTPVPEDDRTRVINYIKRHVAR